MPANLERFILISRPKLVRPTNVMGPGSAPWNLLRSGCGWPDHATERGSGLCSMVRFGNVLGSSVRWCPCFVSRSGPARGRSRDPPPRSPLLHGPFGGRPGLVLQAAGLARAVSLPARHWGETELRLIVDLARQMVRALRVADSATPTIPTATSRSSSRAYDPAMKLYEELLIGTRFVPPPIRLIHLPTRAL